MEINLRVQRHPSSWLFVVKEMDGGSLCQPHAAAITPAAMMDGGEGEGGEEGRGASITALNLPVTARAWMREGWARSRLHFDCWPTFSSSAWTCFFPLLGPESLNSLITSTDFIGCYWTWGVCLSMSSTSRCCCTQLNRTPSWSWRINT